VREENVGMAGRFCKLCALEDFGDASLRTLIRSAFAYRAKRDAAFPSGREYRKLWEVGMSLRAFRELGLLGTSRFLGVGAGAEPTLFWLTHRARCVVATDLYDEAWGEQAPPTMLSDPGVHATCPWDPRRLVVERMDARELRFEDNSFDGVFSASAIEHFGDYEDVRRALTEVRRVLRPGGIATLSTEYRVSGAGPGLPGVLIFDEAELRSVLEADGSTWELVEPLDVTISEATLQTVVDFDEAAADVMAGRDWRTYPHILLRHSSGVTWTSVHVVLRRQGL
jgi:SAM-dependent methyltransferase